MPLGSSLGCGTTSAIVKVPVTLPERRFVGSSCVHCGVELPTIGFMLVGVWHSHSTIPPAVWWVADVDVRLSPSRFSNVSS